VARKKQRGRPQGFTDVSVIRADFALLTAKADALYAESSDRDARSAGNAAAARKLRQINPRWKSKPSKAHKLIQDRKRAWDSREQYAKLVIPGPPTCHDIRDDILAVARNPALGEWKNARAERSAPIDPKAELRRNLLHIIEDTVCDGRLSPRRKRNNRRRVRAVVRSVYSAALQDIATLLDDPPTETRETVTYRVDAATEQRLRESYADLEGAQDLPLQELLASCGVTEEAEKLLDENCVVHRKRVEAVPLNLHVPLDRLLILTEILEENRLKFILE